MKALVMTAMFIVTSSLTAVLAGTDNGKNKFAYNERINEQQQMTEQTVYTVTGDGRYLKNHLKYEYTYDEEGRVSLKEVLRWNEVEQAFERHYCIRFGYDGGDVRMELALWNKEKQAYTETKAMSLYRTDNDGRSYQCYEWNTRSGEWNLLVEHVSANRAEELLAERER